MKRGRVLLLIVISFILGTHFALGLTGKTVSSYGMVIYLSYAVLLVVTLLFVFKAKDTHADETGTPASQAASGNAVAGWYDAGVDTYSSKNKHGQLQGLSDGELFRLFDKRVRREKLFLDYNLGRDDYMRIMGVNKNRFGSIVKKFVGGNISTYLNGLRLEHSIKLMLDNPGMPVSEVARRSAFPNLPTYYRLFKEEYGCSPASYRNNK